MPLKDTQIVLIKQHCYQELMKHEKYMDYRKIGKFLQG